VENKNFQTLKRQSDFKQLKENGKFLSASDWLLINYSKNSHGYLRPGWTVSRKVGKSVVRNRLKRWGREFVRKQSSDAVDFNLIFRAKKEKEFFKSLSHRDFEKVLTDAFTVIKKRL